MSIKGGTGKTITAVNLAHAFAQAGQRTLLVDLDSQASATMALGFHPSPAAFELLMGRGGKPFDPDQQIIQAREHLDLIPADAQLAVAELQLALQAHSTKSKSSTTAARNRLTQGLAVLSDDYDAVLIDCRTGEDELLYNALTFADEVILTVSVDFLNLVGAKPALKTIVDMFASAGKSAVLKHIVPTRYAPGAESDWVLERLRNDFSGFVTAPIHEDAALSGAPRYGQTIFEFAAASIGAADYQALSQRMLDE